MVNRLYLRTPRKKIIEQAHIVQRKRIEFITAISKGLVPPETPPSLRKKKRRKYSIDLEDVSPDMNSESLSRCSILTFSLAKQNSMAQTSRASRKVRHLKRMGDPTTIWLINLINFLMRGAAIKFFLIPLFQKNIYPIPGFQVFERRNNNKS